MVNALDLGSSVPCKDLRVQLPSLVLTSGIYRCIGIHVEQSVEVRILSAAYGPVAQRESTGFAIQRSRYRNSPGPCYYICIMKYDDNKYSTKIHVYYDRHRWERCPICHGTGTVSSGFYSPHGYDLSFSMKQEKCHSCDGRGIVR